MFFILLSSIRVPLPFFFFWDLNFFFFFEQYRPEKEKGTAQDRGAGGQVGLEDAVLIGERGTLALGPKRGRGFYMLCVNVFFFFFPGVLMDFNVY